jgi:hypothetical protein
MNLYDIMMGAQGGQGVNNLATQFGLSPQQTQAAIQAMIPAFSLGLQRTAQDPTGFGGLLNQMTSGAHAAAYVDPAQTAAASNLGGNVLGQIFGSPQVAAQVGQQAAQMSGVNAQIIQQMMPVVASMLVGGIANAMAAQGLGGVLSQIANAFTQGAGLAPAVNPAAAAQAQAGNMFNSWMNMVGGMFTGAAGTPAPPATPQAAALQATVNSLNTMLQAGVQISQAHQQGLATILESISKAAKG